MKTQETIFGLDYVAYQNLRQSILDEKREFYPNSSLTFEGVKLLSNIYFIAVR